MKKYLYIFLVIPLVILIGFAVGTSETFAEAPAPGVISTNPPPGTSAPAPGVISTNPPPGTTAPAPGVISTNPPPSTFQLQNPLSDDFDTVGGLVSGFVRIFTYLIIIVAVILLIWTGLQFVLAMGNVEKLKELKTRLLYIVIGVAIVIGARVIVMAVLNTLEATGTVDSGVINSANNGLNQSR